MVAPLVAAAPLVGKGVAVGAASFGANKVLDKFFPKEDEAEMEQMQMASGIGPGGVQMAGMSPQMMSPQAGMAQMGYGPAGMGMAGAGAAAGSVMAVPASTRTAPQAEAEVPFDDAGNDGFMKSAGKTLLAAGAGGVAGFMLKKGQVEEEGLEGKDKFAALSKGVLAGAGSGAFAKLGLDAIQEEGGGIKAALSTGAASSLASTLQQDGPGMFSSFGMGAGAGAASNLAHDALEKSGHSKMADAVGGAGLGGVLGYTTTGDFKGAGIGSAGGGALSTAGGMLREGSMGDLLAEGSPLDKLMPGSDKASEPEKDSGFSL